MNTIVSELSLAMRGSKPMLPLELWHVICENVVADDGEPGERWAVKQSVTGQWQTRLRGLSQVNHALRRVLMPFLWESVLFVARKMEDLIGLAQLSHDLSIRGPLLSAADCLAQIEFQVDCDHLRLPGKHSKPDDDESMSREALKKLMRCRMGSGPEDEGALPLTLRRLSHALIGCKQLATLKWRGWLEPDPQMLVNISQCTSLQDLSVDLGTQEYGDMLGRWQLPASVREMDSDVVATPAVTHTIPRVFFAVVTTFEGCKSCGYSHLALESEIDPALATPAVKMLTDFRFMESFTLGAPKLLYDRWMVPLWAQLERLELDPDYSEPDVRGEDGGWSYTNQRDPEMDDRMLRHAQVLPHVLDCDEAITQLLRGQRDDDDAVDAVSRAVHKAINASEDLREWQYWFDEWTEESWDYDVEGHASTITIMRDVAEVLIGRHKRTTEKRGKYTTAKPSGYLCQSEMTR